MGSVSVLAGFYHCLAKDSDSHVENTESGL